jgi:predicted metal-dependent HD superfamily phosphohydrolase
MPTLLESLNNYSSPERGYHGLMHIAKMTELAKMCNVTLSDTQLLDIFFHDVVYIPGATDNEEKSAQFAIKFLTGQPDIDKQTISKVSQIILDTKDHKPTIEESKAVIDLDLAGLAMDWDIYIENFNAIQWEYKSLSDVEFAKGRIKFINEYINRPNIFVGPLGIGDMDKYAKQNLQKEKEIMEKIINGELENGKKTSNNKKSK